MANASTDGGWARLESPARVTRRRFLAASGSLAGAALLGACTRGKSGLTPTSSYSPGGKPSGSLTMGIDMSIQHLNPLPSNESTYSSMVGYALYDALFRVSNDAVPIPQIAEDLQLAPDRTSLAIKVRDGVTFANGKPLTAEDVAWSAGYLLDPKIYTTLRGYSSLPAADFGSIDVKDMTVTVTTKKPYRLIDLLTDDLVVPAHADKLYGAKLNTTSFGTGPFRVQSFMAGSTIKLTANADYWGGPPGLETLEFRELADIATKAANLRSGEIQGVFNVRPAELKEIGNVSGTRTVSNGSTTIWYQPQMNFGPLRDPNVRGALRYCFNKQAMNDAAYAGQAVDAHWNYFSVTPYAISEQLNIPYDPDKARALLAQAGASGISVPIYSYSGDDTVSRLGLILQEGLKSAGLKCDYTEVSSAEWLSHVYGKRDWDGLTPNGGPPLPFPEYWTLDFTLNLDIRKQLPALGKLLDEAHAASDTELPKIFQEAQRLILRYTPTYHTLIAPVVLIIPDNLEGVFASRFGYVYFDKAHYV